MLGAIEPQQTFGERGIDEPAMVHGNFTRMRICHEVLAGHANPNFRKMVRLLQIADQRQQGGEQLVLCGFRQAICCIKRKVRRLRNPVRQGAPGTA